MKQLLEKQIKNEVLAKYFEVFVENSQEKFKFFSLRGSTFAKKKPYLSIAGGPGEAAPPMVRIFQFQNWDIHYKNEPQHGFREKFQSFHVNFELNLNFPLKIEFQLCKIKGKLKVKGKYFGMS